MIDGNTIFYGSLLCTISAFLFSAMIGFQHFMLIYIALLLITFVGGHYIRKRFNIR